MRARLLEIAARCGGDGVKLRRAAKGSAACVAEPLWLRRNGKPFRYVDGKPFRYVAGFAATAWLLSTTAVVAIAQPHALVMQSDFGLKDGAVAAMKGVAFGVDSRLPMFDLSHENTPYDIWQGAYRLKQTAPYWPAGTVFLSVIDPGVGTDRASVVLRTTSGHYFVSPDNGTLTLVAEDLGIDAVRRIDEKRHRLAGSEKSYTFHGRDVYAFTAARLASGVITFEEVGPVLPADVVKIPYTRATRDGDRITGVVAVLDPNYGNLWTNIPDSMLAELEVALGEAVRVSISHGDKPSYVAEVPYVSTFGAVGKGEPLLYLNSLLNVSLALNQRSFAETYGIRAGGEWKITIEKLKR